MASEKFSVSACTLLDATPVRHLDWQTAKITPDFWEAERKVKEKYAKYWAQVRNIDCMLAHKQQRVTTLAATVATTRKCCKCNA
eukprot:g29300.t1